MTKPKRHHWWPMAQSRHWADSESLVFVTRSDGTTFRVNPVNIGVESELYTRFIDDAEKSPEVEEWFSATIDGPATRMIEHLLDPANISRSQFQGHPGKVKVAETLGFRINHYVDRVHLPAEIRKAISRYLAALLVRHPSYLTKLTLFHQSQNTKVENAKNRALDSMLDLYSVYEEKISKSAFLITRRVGSAEYLYADGGLMVEEPWRKSFGIPFDIHAPLTPDIAIQVLPIPYPVDLGNALVAEAADQGVACQNRIILGGASRFVFSRQVPPTDFIQENFGKPAPKNIGYGIVNGRLVTHYDPSRK